MVSKHSVMMFIKLLAKLHWEHIFMCNAKCFENQDIGCENDEMRSVDFFPGIFMHYL